MSRRLVACCAPLLALSCGHPAPRTADPIDTVPPKPVELRDSREVHLGEIKQLTHGGENAEAYWSFDGTQLIFQSKRPPYACDQIFRMPADGSGEPTLESSGKGRTTCSYFYPGDRRVLYSSTHLGGDDCPPEPDRSQGYVWALYDSYDIFHRKLDGTDAGQLTTTPGYDAEATVCAKTGQIVFTSMRDGDLELYTMDPDGKNVVRLTNTPGYDGGAFFSADCKQLVWRASRPRPGGELEDYQRLLGLGLVRPTKLELWVAKADGTEARQITYLDAATFAPSFFPSGDRVIFSSNYGDAKGREFDIWAINTDGTGLERITWAGGFDGFPLFSPDGTRLAFSSNRNQAAEGDTDVYVATWVDAPKGATLEPRAADRVRADVEWLADDEREGRGAGTMGLEAASIWLSDQLASIGVEAAAGDGYRQTFDITIGVKVGAATAVTIDGEAVAPDQFRPVGFATSADVSGELVFAGYGITAKDLGVDDYKKVDARGKIVVVRRYTPSGGKFDDDKAQRRYGDLRWKAWNAREHGAKALLVVDLPAVGKGQQLPEEAPLPMLVVDSHGDAGIPIVVLTRAGGETLFAKAKKKRSAQVKVALEFTKKPAHNVVGRIAAGAADKLPGVVVIGAHYDHLGMGGAGSLSPGVTAVHNGADDNASGTAALLEVARVLQARRAELRRDVWIVAFSGEEWGALGSAFFVKTPPAGLAIADVVAMLNMDMVGRLRDNRLSVLGSESAAEWSEVVVPACGRLRVDCVLGGDGYGPSDQISFYTAGIPVLHFFTGAHDDYHTPSDDANRVFAGGGAQVAGVVADIGLDVANRPQRLTLKEAPAPATGGDLRSYGASLGTIPDYSGSADGKVGVLLAGVRPDSPAAKAGMQRGDRLVKIGKHEIRNVEDFMFVLRNSKPGETTTVIVERDGKRLEMKVTFGKSTRTR